VSDLNMQRPVLLAAGAAESLADADA